MWKKLVKRRVQKSYCHGKTSHRPEYSYEIHLLKRKQFGKGLLSSLHRLGKNHFPDGLYPVRPKEHMLGPAEPYPFSAEIPRHRSIVRSICICSNLKYPQLISPFHKLLIPEVMVRISRQKIELALVHTPLCPVKGDPVIFSYNPFVDVYFFLLHINIQRRAPDDTAFTPSPCNEGSMACHPAFCGEYCVCGMHSMNVFRGRLISYKDNLLPFLCPFFSIVGSESHSANRPARACRQPFRQFHGLLLSRRINARVQKFIQLIRLHPKNRGLL